MSGKVDLSIEFKRENSGFCKLASCQQTEAFQRSESR